MPSINDVAKLAGVSTATVSHVFNETRHVTAETVRRVREAAERLDYRPSRIASALRSRRTMTIGAVFPVPDLLPFPMLALTGAEGVLDEAGYDLVFLNSRGDEQRERAAVETLRTRSVDGLLWMPLYQSVIDSGVLTRLGAPAVLLEAEADGVDSVVSDVYPEFRRAIAELLASGRRRIGLVRNQADVVVNAAKLAAYLDAHAAAGVEVIPELHVIGPATFAGGEAGVNGLLDRRDIDGLVIANHLMLLGGLRVLSRRPDVPSDLPVIGAEHYEWIGVSPVPVTIVEQDPTELGRMAARVLLRRISDPATAPAAHRVPARLTRFS